MHCTLLSQGDPTLLETGSHPTGASRCSVGCGSLVRGKAGDSASEGPVHSGRSLNVCVFTYILHIFHMCKLHLFHIICTHVCIVLLFVSHWVI